VADVISAVLARHGFDVDVKSVKEKPSLEGYHEVILGSAIRMGEWRPEMLEFIRTNQAKLSQIPTAIFTVHMLNTGKDNASRGAKNAYTIPVRTMITPVNEAFFAGEVNPAKLSVPNQVLARIVAGDAGPKIGDFREWDKVRAWAKEISI